METQLDWRAEAAARKAAIGATLAEMGLTVESQFVPFSQSRNKGEKSHSLNWRVTLKRNGRDVLSTDYGAGSGHCPGYDKAPPSNWDRPARMWREAVTAWECENGFAADFASYGGFRARIGRRDGRESVKLPILPDAADVVASLTLDSGVLDFATYEEWAAEFGYDPDSRKGEATYRECLKLALQMRAGIGEDGLAKLREAFQDY